MTCLFRTRKCLAFVATGLALVPLMGSGCPPTVPGGGGNNPGLAGVWTLTRGAVKVTFSYSGSHNGVTDEKTTTSELGPLNPADYPEFLGDLVTQWNDGLDDLNAKLDAALPESVIVTFPTVISMKLTDPNDNTKTVEGLYDVTSKGYLFAGDLSGGGQGSDQGGGAALTVATIDGHFDEAALTTNGKIARTLVVLLVVPNSGLVITAQVSVDFTGTRTGDVP